MQLFARTGNARNKRQHIFAEPLDDIALRIARSEHRKPASAQAERDDRAAFVVALPPGVGIAAALVGDPSHIAIQGMRERDGVDDDQERRQLRQVLRGPLIAASIRCTSRLDGSSRMRFCSCWVRSSSPCSCCASRSSHS